MHRIAVVGEKDCIYGFSAIGLETFFVKTLQEAKIIIKKLIKENFAIIYLTESIIEAGSEDIFEDFKDEFVSIIPIPGISKGSTDVGMKNLKKNVIKAVGTDILFS